MHTNHGTGSTIVFDLAERFPKSLIYYQIQQSSKSLARINMTVQYSAATTMLLAQRILTLKNFLLHQPIALTNLANSLFSRIEESSSQPI